jgi:hypothetical protein
MCRAAGEDSGSYAASRRASASTGFPRRKPLSGSFWDRVRCSLRQPRNPILPTAVVDHAECGIRKRTRGWLSELPQKRWAALNGQLPGRSPALLPRLSCRIRLCPTPRPSPSPYIARSARLTRLRSIMSERAVSPRDSGSGRRPAQGQYLQPTRDRLQRVHSARCT